MRRLRACSLGELNGSRKTLDLLPPGPMRAQGTSVPMAVSVPIATGEETLRSEGLKYVKGQCGRAAGPEDSRNRARYDFAPPRSVMNSRRCSGRDVRFMARPPPSGRIEARIGLR
jgi:hypothetical protein